MVWNGCGLPSAPERQYFAVQDDVPGAQRAYDLDQLGHGRGHVPEPPGEHRHLRPHLVDLDPGAVHLVFQGRGAELLQRFGDVVAGLSQRREDRAPGRELEAAHAGFALGQGDRGHVPQGAVDEVGPADGPGRQPGRPGHGLHHDALQGAVTHFALYEALEKVPLGFRRPSHQRGQKLRPAPARSRTRRLPHGLEAGVGLGQSRAGNAGSRTRKGVLQHGPTDADPALGQLAAQIGHRDANLRRLQAAKTFGQAPDLGQPARIASDLPGSLGKLMQLHQVILIT